MALLLPSDLSYSSGAVAVGFVVVFLLSLYRLYKSRNYKGRNLIAQNPPFPGIPLIQRERHWFFGHFYITATGPDKKRLDLLGKQQVWCVDYADPTTGLSSFFLFSEPAVSVLKYQHAQKILKANTMKATSQVGPAVFFRRIGQKAFGKNNIVRMNGREWRMHRASASRALTSESALRVARGHILSVGNTLVESVVQRAALSTKSEGGDEQCKTVTLNAVKLMKMATMDVFGAAALGRELGCCKKLEPSVVASSFDFIGEDVFRRVRSVLNPASHLYFLPTKANKTFHREKKVLNDFLHETIDMHMQKFNDEEGKNKESDSFNGKIEKWDFKNNLLSQMLAINFGKGVDEEARLSVDEIVDALVTMLFAGYDTTANALSFSLHEIATNPIVEKNCVAEACRVLDDWEKRKRNAEANADDEDINVLEDLPYCYAVLAEALRLHPPAVAVIRNLEKPMQLDGIDLPAGTSVRIPIFHIHRDKRNFDRPDEFLPDRWVTQVDDERWRTRNLEDSNEDTESSKQLPVANRDAFLSFSSGARNCVGKRFAVQEGTLLLAIIVRRLKIVVQEGYVLQYCNSGPIMEPKGGLPLSFRSR